MCSDIDTAGDDTTVLGEEGSEDEGADSGELDKDVDGGAGGVLERVTDGVTSDGSGVLGVTLLDNLVVAIIVLSDELSSLYVLLGVVPRTARVGGGEGDLDARDDAASEHTVGGLVAEEETSEERGGDDEHTWEHHLLEGGVGGDADAALVVRLLILLGRGVLHSVELRLDFSEHVLGGITDGLHGHGGEPVWEHGTDEETSESEWLKDVHAVGGISKSVSVLSLIHI